jgi:hypothetical protein
MHISASECQDLQEPMPLSSAQLNFTLQKAVRAVSYTQRGIFCCHATPLRRGLSRVCKLSCLYFLTCFQFSMEGKRMRSFRGCQSCKIAKRRCSEEKPSCASCARAGRHCQVLFVGALLIVVRHRCVIPVLDV